MGISCCHTLKSQREVVTGVAQGPPWRYTHEVSGKKLHMWWPGLDKEIENLATSCTACHAVKRAPTVPLHPWIWPLRPWQRVHLDFAGPFQGVMFLIAVDAYSKWPEVRVMSTSTVSATLHVLRVVLHPWNS